MHEYDFTATQKHRGSQAGGHASVLSTYRGKLRVSAASEAAVGSTSMKWIPDKIP
jgi:hypothetical protein